MGRQGGLTRCHVVVRGRVQGVGFRWFVREHARELRLSGSVRNRPDGGVELVAEGDAASLAMLMEQLAIGPDGAVVAAVDVLAPVADDAILPSPFAIEK